MATTSAKGVEPEITAHTFGSMGLSPVVHQFGQNPNHEVREVPSWNGIRDFIHKGSGPGPTYVMQGDCMINNLCCWQCCKGKGKGSIMGKSNGFDDGDTPYGNHRDSPYDRYDHDHDGGGKGKGSKGGPQDGGKGNEGPELGKGHPQTHPPVAHVQLTPTPERHPATEMVDENHGGDHHFLPEDESEVEGCPGCPGCESQSDCPDDGPDDESQSPSANQQLPELSELPEGYRFPDSDSDTDAEMARSHSDDSSVDEYYNSCLPNPRMDDASTDPGTETPGPTPSPGPGPGPGTRPTATRSDHEPHGPTPHHPYFPSWACHGFSQMELMRVAARFGPRCKAQHTSKAQIQKAVRKSKRDWRPGMRLLPSFDFKFMQRPQHHSYQPPVGQEVSIEIEKETRL